MRVVHCANFAESKLGSAYYAIDRKISNGLIRNGHFVYDYSYREFAKYQVSSWRKKKRSVLANAGLLEVVKNIQPDFLLLGHSELISTKTLQQIRELVPKIRIAMWWVDWVYNLIEIRSRLECIDHFFITTDPSELHQWIEGDSIMNKCSYMPNICDQSMETHKGFERDSYQFDVLFVGRYDDERQALVDYLKSELGHYRLGLFGGSRDELLTGAHYMETIASSKIAINYNRNNSLKSYSSDRVIQLVGNGTMVMSPTIPGFNTVFGSDEMIFFNDFPDMKKKIQLYLEDDVQRKVVARAGWLRAHSQYNETEVVRQILEKVFGKNG